jgi:hypothetical protein
MSSALAIAGVSAVLQFYLTNLYTGISALFGGSVTVSSKAPDLVQESFGTGASENQINLFLHQVTHNQGWRNECLPSTGADGRTRIGNPPLALDLHYLLTAYGSENWQAEALLGYALLMLHENPVLTRNDIGNAIAKLPLNDPGNPLSTPLGSAGLANQIELLKITPATLGREEMAWLWTALKADYRPTFPFQVSVVLIEPQNPAISPLPVLQREIVAQPNILSPFPTLTAVVPPNGQPAAGLGDTVTIQGSHLVGASAVLLLNSLCQIQQSITTLLNVGNASFQFIPPKLNAPGELAAGIYSLTVQVPSGSDILNTNSLPFTIAPNISTWSPGIIPSGSATLVVPCSPFVRPGQKVFLIIGDQQAAADPFTTATNGPSFTFPSLQPTGGPVPARLRVDGIDSPVIDMTKTPPVFSGPLVQVT